MVAVVVVMVLVVVVVVVIVIVTVECIMEWTEELCCGRDVVSAGAMSEARTTSSGCWWAGNLDGCLGGV